MPSAIPDIFFIVVLTTTVWVGVDASSRDLSKIPIADKTWKWVLGSLLLWIIIFPVYLMKRSEAPRKT